MSAMDSELYDCVVVGAGAAGLSAALVLGRARVKTLVVDAGEQSNLASTGIGGLLGADQSPPAAFYAAARDEVGRYEAVLLRDGAVTGGSRGEDGVFTLTLDGGYTIGAVGDAAWLVPAPAACGGSTPADAGAIALVQDAVALAQFSAAASPDVSVDTVFHVCWQAASVADHVWRVDSASTFTVHGALRCAVLAAGAA